MIRGAIELTALVGAAILMTTVQGCDSSSTSQAGTADEARGGGSSALTAGTFPIEGAFNIDLGYQLNVMSGDFEHKNLQGLLFADGWVFKDIPRLHLDDFDVEQSRKDDIRKWGEWKSEGDALAIRWYDKSGALGDWKTYENWLMFENPTAGESLDGTYKILNVASHSGGSREIFATGWKVVTFGADGRFTESSGHATTVGTGDSGQADEGLSLSTGGSDSTKGRYQITDSDIQFTFDDGSERENSIFFSSSEKKVIFINGVKFIRG